MTWTDRDDVALVLDRRRDVAETPGHVVMFGRNIASGSRLEWREGGGGMWRSSDVGEQLQHADRGFGASLLSFRFVQEYK